MENKTIVIENGLSNQEKRTLLKTTKELIHLLEYDDYIEILMIFNKALDRIGENER